jgi:hypothetical protein
MLQLKGAKEKLGYTGLDSRLRLFSVPRSCQGCLVRPKVKQVGLKELTRSDQVVPEICGGATVYVVWGAAAQVMAWIQKSKDRFMVKPAMTPGTRP